MSHETLTAERALELLREVVADRLEYVYQSPSPSGMVCLYIDPADRRPSCLIGHVLTRAGWGPDELEHSNDVNVVSLFERHPEWKPDASALLILGVAQSSQDVGETWAQALAKAEAIA